MSWEQIAGLVLVVLVMGLGVVGSVLPALPGPPLILAAAVGHWLWFREQSVNGWVLGVMAGLTVGALALDALATLVGARKLGATWRGVLGAGLGVMVGIFTGPLGIVAGPLVGATLGEWLGGRALPEASRAGLGAVLGVVAGAAGKFACSLAMVALFVVNLAWRS